MQEIANIEFNYVSNLGMFCNFDTFMHYSDSDSHSRAKMTIYSLCNYL